MKGYNWTNIIQFYRETRMLALFEKFPRLKEQLPYAALGQFPTPVERMERLGAAVDAPQLYVKREDVTGKLYGGNKVRALEFLLGAAVRSGDKVIWTLGRPATCQALAQAIYARQLGLKNLSFLFPQLRSEQGRRHLLVYQGIAAEIYQVPNFWKLFQHRIQDGKFPRFIEASSPLGVVGYVNAIIELEDQIEGGLLPEPDVIYLALATAGTMAGLVLGLRAMGLKSRVVGAGPKKNRFNQPQRLAKLFRETNELLHAHDPSFPLCAIEENDFDARYGYSPGENQLLTRAGEKAVKKVKELAGLQLDEMFTANAFVALLEDAEKGRLVDKNVLWWNTYSSVDFSSQVAAADYRRLPKAFHKYFI